MKIICYKCNNGFEPKHDMLKETYLGAMITEVYFKCPYCNKKYLICVKTSKARKLMLNIKKYEILDENIKIEESKKKLKFEMDKINGK